jgi:hypothetical protein
MINTKTPSEGSGRPPGSTPSSPGTGLYLMRRRTDGRYFRGSKLWRWTRFRRLAARCEWSVVSLLFVMGTLAENEIDLLTDC